MNCPTCGTTIEGGRFCASCGTALELRTRCGGCDHHNQAGATFCSNCGRPQ
ncbi:double zinc ribbon domain-containing protein [Nocardia africana]|uniref:Zinc ribbon domain-containing protein n=1 Tax=Nocardia africana TaxID=134964 RepID=A0ABW6NDW3_9NOCA